MQKRLDQAEAEILDLGRKISSAGKTDELAAALQIATGTYTTLAEKLEQLRINERLESGPGRVVSPAVVDADPVSPKPLRNVVLGLVVGLVFGLGMAFLYEYLDNTIKSTEEAERIFGAAGARHRPGSIRPRRARSVASPSSSLRVRSPPRPTAFFATPWTSSTSSTT